MDLKKIMNTDYLGSWDFKENEVKTLNIKIVEQRKVFNPTSNREELSLVMFFNNYPLGMFVNVTNAKMLIKLFGTSETDYYKGKNISLKTSKIRVKGETIDAVRIADKLPPQNTTQTAPPVKVDFNENHEGWQAAINSLIAKTVTIEQIKGKYILSPENEQKLIQLSTTNTEKNNEESPF